MSKTECFVIDCEKKTMPYWIEQLELVSAIKTDISFPVRILTPEEKKIVRQRFNIISNILPVITDSKLRNFEIEKSSIDFNITKQTVRKYLCLYLVYQDINCFAPDIKKERELTKDEKNIRWALNKFFYTTDKNTLKTAYRLMLKNKYCDSEGDLFQEYPSFYQFRYFYRKTKNIQNYYISRNGLKNYQRNNRPLLGDGVQNFVGNIGTYMLDATVCDIYLINEEGGIVGRPILTVSVDAYSELCTGYSLSWEGGVYSLRNLVLNIVSNKKSHCQQYGICISEEEWPCSQLGGRLMTDMGQEYVSDCFAQLSELGISITNIQPYRPDLKSCVEKFFDCIQGYYKPYLKGKGVIESDFQERGVHDYRLDACLTMNDFTKIILRAIMYYNSQKILENFQYSEEMIESGIKPYSNSIWNWGINQVGANLIEVEKEQVVLTLLPRTIGQFTKYGLKVNKMRYSHDNYTQQFLSEKKNVTVAYNPDDVSFVWLIEKNGTYIKFELIESRYAGITLEKVQELKKKQNDFLNSFQKERLQAEINLAKHIQVIANNANKQNRTLNGIRENRKNEQMRTHIDFVKEVNINE